MLKFDYGLTDLQELTPSVFDNLTEKGFFYDPVQREVEIVFLPWILDQMSKELDKKNLTDSLLDGKLS